MTIGISSRSIFLGLLALVGVTAAAGLYVWAESVPLGDDGRTGQQILLLLFSPFAAGACAIGAVKGFRRIWEGLTRYQLTEDDLIVRNPLWARVIPWASIDDFLLPAANFPYPPGKLILLSQCQRIELPLERFRAGGAEAALLDLVPGLASWGLERVRAEQPATLSPLRVRWRLYNHRLPGVFMGAIFLPMGILAGLLMSWNYVNYLRICQSHLSAPGLITKIIKPVGDKESARTIVCFIAFDGRKFNLRREVFRDFPEKFKIGDQVDVDYLPSDPTIGRIRHWDLDGRQWPMLILLVPFIWMMYRVTRQGVVDWVRPLRDRLEWTTEGGSSDCSLSGMTLETIAAMLPERQQGVWILRPPVPPQMWAKTFAKAGLESGLALQRHIVLAPEQARRLMNRLGQPVSGWWDYLVLSGATTETAESELQQLIAWFAGNDVVKPAVPGRAQDLAEDPPAPCGLRMYKWSRKIGPLDDAAKRRLFQNWLTLRLHHLYGGLMPADLSVPDVTALTGIDPAQGPLDVLLERRESGPRVYVRLDAGKLARLFEFRNGRWIDLGEVRAPRSLATRRRRIPTRCLSPAGSE